MVIFETILLLIGLISEGFYLYVLSNWDQLDHGFREFFRGGELGGIVLGLGMILGAISGFVFLGNIINGKRKLWYVRLILLILFSIGFLMIAQKI